MSFDSIRNYYETLVQNEVIRQTASSGASEDYRCDIACVALNHLPPRYIRHEVDMIFYLSPIEREEISEKVRKSVERAIKFISEKKDLSSN